MNFLFESVFVYLVLLFHFHECFLSVYWLGLRFTHGLRYMRIVTLSFLHVLYVVVFRFSEQSF